MAKNKDSEYYANKLKKAVKGLCVAMDKAEQTNGYPCFTLGALRGMIKSRKAIDKAMQWLEQK